MTKDNFRSYKIINDPIYGFISIPRGIFLELLDHPWMQRLRRISQLGCSHLVYPGAVHSRFHHVMGAFYLMQKAIQVLEAKGTRISKEEKEGVCLAILLHDLGHGPYSHALENHLLPHSHEKLTLAIIRQLNQEFNGRLEVAEKIFSGQYHRPFLNQLVAGQLDMDRMDYLSRDSFYTGVAEGVISYDRITHMLNTVDDQLVIEEKGIYSLEKFLTARKLMYWQVYLHKTALSAEKMLLSLIKRIKVLLKDGYPLPVCHNLKEILLLKAGESVSERQLQLFRELDDVSILYSLKQLRHSEDFICGELSTRFLDRKLLKIKLSDHPISEDDIHKHKTRLMENFPLSENEVNYLLLTGEESNTAYRIHRDEIIILKKNGQTLPYSSFPNQVVSSGKLVKHYLISPALIN